MSPAGILRFSDAENDGKDRTEAVMRAASLRIRLDDLADAFAADEIDRETLARASFPLRVDLKEAEREAQHAYLTSPMGTITGPASALAAWRRDDMPLDERRALVTRILKSPVLIHRKSKGERITTKHVTIK